MLPENHDLNAVKGNTASAALATNAVKGNTASAALITDADSVKGAHKSVPQDREAPSLAQDVADAALVQAEGVGGEDQRQSTQVQRLHLGSNAANSSSPNWVDDEESITGKLIALMSASGVFAAAVSVVLWNVGKIAKEIGFRITLQADATSKLISMVIGTVAFSLLVASAVVFGCWFKSKQEERVAAVANTDLLKSPVLDSSSVSTTLDIGEHLPSTSVLDDADQLHRGNRGPIV